MHGERESTGKILGWTHEGDSISSGQIMCTEKENRPERSGLDTKKKILYRAGQIVCWT